MEWNRTDLKEDVSVCATADLVQHLSLATEDVLNKFFFFLFVFLCGGKKGADWELILSGQPLTEH